jgi:hypothetical protein
VAAFWLICRRFVAGLSLSPARKQGQTRDKSARKLQEGLRIMPVSFPGKVIKPEYPADQLMADYPQKKYCLE